MFELLYLAFSFFKDSKTKQIDEAARQRAIDKGYTYYIGSNGINKNIYTGNPVTREYGKDGYIVVKDMITGEVIENPMLNTVAFEKKVAKSLMLNGKIEDPIRPSYCQKIHRTVLRMPSVAIGSRDAQIRLTHEKFYDVFLDKDVYYTRDGFRDYRTGRIVRILFDEDLEKAKEYNEKMDKLETLYPNDFKFNYYKIIITDQERSNLYRKYGVGNKDIPCDTLISVNTTDKIETFKALFGKEIYDE